MSTHVYGLTVETIQGAWYAAATVDHSVTLVDDASHMMVVVDQKGHVIIRPEDWLYRVVT